MKFSVAAASLALASSVMGAVTVITATNEGNVYTKTIELADTDATLAEGEYLTSIIVTRGDAVYTKVITESSTGAAAETTSAAAETTSAAAETTSAAAETTSTAAETTSTAAETTSAAAETTSSSAAAETTTADVATYTGGAALASVGTGLLGVAVAGLLI